ncbi:MAG: hypothetical protein GTO12_03200 [Proteobacteria bacterium]|nr:hypothetical protein [Pseudomonadota bacterium]
MDRAQIKSEQHDDQRYKAASVIDIDRALLRDQDLFPPFEVKDTVPLSMALTQGDVGKDTPIVLLETETRWISLLTYQMTYHHVAQGEIPGHPWMVTF